MANKQIKIDLIIDGKNAVATIKNADAVTKALGKQAQTTSTKLSNIGNIATGIKSAFDIVGSAFRTVDRYVDVAIEKYKIQEQAEAQLTQALGHRSEALIEFAAVQQSVTTHGDEEIIKAQALIGMFVKDEEQIKKLTKATLDLADAKGMDLAAAADLVSKTIGSSTNALSRYGIKVDGAVGSSERLDSLLKNINEKFGGQAIAKAATETGKLTQAQNLLGDQMERIGKLTIQIVQPLESGLADIAKGLLDVFIGKSKLDAVTDSTIEQMSQFNNLIFTYEDLRKTVNRTDGEQKLYLQTIDKLQKQYPDYLGNIDLEKASYESVETAINSARKELEKLFDQQVKNVLLQDKKEELAELAKEEAALLKIRETQKKHYEDLQKSGDADKQKLMMVNEELVNMGTYGENAEIAIQGTQSAIDELVAKKQEIFSTVDALSKLVQMPTEEPNPTGGKGTSQIVARPTVDLSLYEEGLLEMLAFDEEYSNKLIDESENRATEILKIKSDYYSEVTFADEDYYQMQLDQIMKTEQERISAGIDEKDAHAAMLQEKKELDKQYIDWLNEQDEIKRQIREDYFSDATFADDEYLQKQLQDIQTLYDKRVAAGIDEKDAYAQMLNDKKNLEDSYYAYKWDQIRKDNALFDGAIKSMDRGWTMFVSSLTSSAMTGKERMNMVWQNMKQVFIQTIGDMVKQWIVEKISAAVFGASMQATEIGKAVATGSAIATAYAPAASMVSLATFGSNSIAAMSGITATSALATSLASIPAFEKGVRDLREDTFALVGEKGPEFVRLPKGADVYNNDETKRINEILEEEKRSNALPMFVDEKGELNNYYNSIENEDVNNNEGSKTEIVNVTNNNVANTILASQENRANNNQAPIVVNNDVNLNPLLDAINEQTERLEAVERTLNIAELDDHLSNYKMEQGEIGNE